MASLARGGALLSQREHLLFRATQVMLSAARPALADPEANPNSLRRLLSAGVLGALVGVLGGLIGLGGAEFRLPILVAVFGFAALQAVILNKALSLIVVIAALPARLLSVPLPAVVAEWPVIVNLLAGTLIGAWLGAGWATRLASRSLYRILASLLVLIAITLVWTHLGDLGALGLTGVTQIVVGVVAGVGIGVVAALMGVAGGELLIPAIVLLFGVDIKLAGSLSLAVSLPTMLVAFARYSRDQAFSVLRDNADFLVAMGLGSVVGVVAGGMLLGVVPEIVLVPLLAVLLLASAVKVWKHAN
ncbi:sulfite exporter TauE/SafE family protein [Propionicimonas sp.]|uniref:sulfite exporter TauE/SafE family protein n=1 Tax=Propionicimonas sp. TaxID=1955623 RepID=UPI0025E58593|nr:sulfite exporter TauE/SafE family protein [Propionicimonas sp.]MCG2805618.1 sulfite exporter TauE/SafE family protein [Propionicimonas sp.]